MENSRKIIMDHFINPEFKKDLNIKGTTKIFLKSDSCADELYLEYLIKDDHFEVLNFTGSACAIATSSADIMIKNALNLNNSEILSMINEFENMLFEKEFNENKIGDLHAFVNVSKQKNRIKCATLLSNGIKNIL